MNNKSIKVLNLLLFSSMACLSGPVLAATAKSTTPALQISDAPWSPPGPPAETASAAQTPAFEISDEAWQPEQSAATKPQTPAPVSEKAAVPPPALYVPGTAPVQSQPVQQAQPLPPVQQARIDVQPVTKAGTVSEPPAERPDIAKIQAQQSRIDSLATQNAELESKLKAAGAQASVAAVAPPANTQVIKTLQDQIDTLAKDNAELQQKLKSASANPAPASSRSAVVASADSKVRITKAEPEQMHVVKFDMKDDDAGLPALAPASGGPIDSVALPGKNEPAQAAFDDGAPVKASLKDEQPQSKAKAASGGTWQEESVEASEPAQAAELDKLKKRYEMSEAENARLGGLVKNEKDQCELDKGKMQQLLFNAQPSDDQQRYITDLEHKLGESQQALAEQKRMYEQKIRALKNRHAAHDSES